MLEVECVQLLHEMSGPHQRAGASAQMLSQDTGEVGERGPPRSARAQQIPVVSTVIDGIGEPRERSPATMFKGRSGDGARAGFTPAELELDARAIMQESRRRPVVVNETRVHLAVMFPGE